MQCWCACGRCSAVHGDVLDFTCECGRRCEIDWRAEIEGREAGDTSGPT